MTWILWVFLLLLLLLFCCCHFISLYESKSVLFKICVESEIQMFATPCVTHTHIRSHTGTQTSILCAHGIYVYILNIKNPMESAHTKLKIACKSNFIPKWNCRYVYIWTKCVIIVYGVNLNMPTGAHCKEKDFFFFFSFCFVFSVVVHINAYFSNNNSDSQSSNCVCCVL